MILADHAKDLKGRTAHFSFAAAPDEMYVIDVADVADDGLVGLTDGRLLLVPFAHLARLEEAAA